MAGALIARHADKDSTLADAPSAVGRMEPHVVDTAITEARTLGTNERTAGADTLRVRTRVAIATHHADEPACFDRLVLPDARYDHVDGIPIRIREAGHGHR
jgi:hypothetical protein